MTNDDQTKVSGSAFLRLEGPDKIGFAGLILISHRCVEPAQMILPK